MTGFVLSKFHSGRAVKKLKKKHAKEQKQLYTQYYNDVYKMQEQINDYAYQVRASSGVSRERSDQVRSEARPGCSKYRYTRSEC